MLGFERELNLLWSVWLAVLIVGIASQILKSESSLLLLGILYQGDFVSVRKHIDWNDWIFLNIVRSCTAHL